MWQWLGGGIAIGVIDMELGKKRDNCSAVLACFNSLALSSLLVDTDARLGLAAIRNSGVPEFRRSGDYAKTNNGTKLRKLGELKHTLHSLLGYRDSQATSALLRCIALCNSNEKF